MLVRYCKAITWLDCTLRERNEIIIFLPVIILQCAFPDIAVLSIFYFEKQSPDIWSFTKNERSCIILTMPFIPVPSFMKRSRVQFELLQDPGFVDWRTDRRQNYSLKTGIPSLLSALSKPGVPVDVFWNLRCPRSNTTILVFSDVKFSGMIIWGAETLRLISHLFTWKKRITLQ